MANSSQVPAAVEGQKLLITGLKITPSAGPPKKIKDTDEIFYPLSVSRNGSSVIAEEYNPPLARFRNYSFVNENDSISGKSLWGLHDEPIGPGDIKVGGKGRSGRHSGQELEISGICYMELISGWVGTSISSHPKDILLT